MGDFFLYAFFLCLGFLHRDGVLAKCNRGWWSLIAFASGFAGGAWVITQPVPDRAVNDSQPAHLFIGFAWLAVFMAAAPLIERLASASFVSDAIRTINSRFLTIYLWHSTAIILGYHLLWSVETPLPRGLFTASVVGLMFAGTAAFVALFGWCEDVAGRRTPQLWPGALARNPRVREPRGRRIIMGALAISGAFAFVSVGATSLAALTASAGARTGIETASSASAATAADEPTTRSLRTPSQAPAPPSVDTDITPVVVTANTAADTIDASSDTAADARVATLVATAQAWIDRNGVAGLQFGISKPGSLYWVDAVGTLGREDSYDTFSVTKTLTTTLILREVEGGRIDLDAPLPPLSALPSFPSSRFTVRQFLSHMSGLVPYNETPTYQANPSSITTAATALAAAAAEPLRFTPGAMSNYSSTNYLVLGLLLEDLTGVPFEHLLSESLTQPLGLSSAVLTPSLPGVPNLSTSGLVMNTADLLAWTSYYFRDHAELSPDTWATLTSIDSATSLGTGLIWYCPCTIGSDGGYEWKAVGYAGPTTVIQYSASDDVAIVVNLSASLWQSDAFFNSVLGLFEALRAVANAG